jgi:DNA-binding transcriptional LysR family regulator
MERHMDLRQLTTFRHLTSTLSFTRTASALGYVQSNVSAQIRSLETELGVRLFERLGRRVVVTEPGLRLQLEADRLLELVRALPGVVLGDVASGTLAISAPESVCTYRLPALLRAYRERCPRARLVFRATPVADLLRRVRAGELDAAFVLEPPLTGRILSTEALGEEGVVLVAAPEHPLAAASVFPRDLEGETLLLTDGGCSYRAQFEHALAVAGVQPAETLEFAGVEAIKQCAIAGMGIAVLPAMSVAAELRAGDLAALRWVGPPFMLTLQLVWHRQKWRSPALDALLALARSSLWPAGMQSPHGDRGPRVRAH